MRRGLLLYIVIAIFVGCGESSSSTNPDSTVGAFNLIKSGIEDMHLDVNNEHYAGDELGSDMLANTIVRWSGATKGTDIETEAEQLLVKYLEVEKLMMSGGNIEELKAGIQELRKIVAAIEKKQR